MEHINLFFCDIVGTISGSVKNTEKDYIKFGDNLKIIAGNKKLFFSLISSDDEYYVRSHFYDLFPYLDGNIIFGKNFGLNGDIDSNVEIIGKVNQIKKYYEELCKDFIIDKIYYAEDVVFNHELLDMIKDKDGWNTEIISFVPDRKLGLVELNELIEERINMYNSNKNKGV